MAGEQGGHDHDHDGRQKLSEVHYVLLCCGHLKAYQAYTDRIVEAEELGFDGLVPNEGYLNIYVLMPVPNPIAAADRASRSVIYITGCCPGLRRRRRTPFDLRCMTPPPT